MSLDRFLDFARAHGLILDRVIADGKIHRVGTLDKPRSDNGRYKIVGEFGWIMDMVDREAIWFKPDNMTAEQTKKFRLAKDKDSSEQEQRYRDAAYQAQQVIQRCKFDHHPYFAKKNLHGTQGLVDPQDGRLVVPMRHWRTLEIQTLQWIDAEGDKRFLTDGKARDAVFSMGPQMADAVAVEGFATGHSVLAALKSLYQQRRVVVCFSAHNLKTVAPLLGPGTLVVADNDKPDRNGRQAGQEAAQASGRPWVVPPDEGTDANDLASASGLKALADLLRKLL